MNAVKEMKKRVLVAGVVFVLLMGLIIFRFTTFQVIKGEEFRQLAEGQRTLQTKLLQERGVIEVTDKYSTKPYLVATNVTRQLLFVDPALVEDPVELSQTLSSILQIDQAELLAKISDKTKRYVPIRKQLSDDMLARIKELKIRGLGFDPELVRVNPEKEFLAHVLGFVGYDGDKRVGLYGIERAFESFLAGKQGRILQEGDSRGRWIFGSKRDVEEPVNGSTILLTVDRSIQYKVEEVLKEAIDTHKADGGSAIVMDPKTGMVLAMASYPTFDVNEYSKAKDPAVFNNNALIEPYEPGSVFKAVTMAAALDTEKVTPDSTYTDTGQVAIDKFVIKNSDQKAHGKRTMTQVMEESLNTGVIYAKNLVGNEKFYEYIKRFGFGEKTGIELPEAKGNLDNLKAKILVNYHTASFGQGILVTPIQLVCAYAAMANKGVMMRPYIVQSVLNEDGTSQNTSPIAVSRVISEKTSEEISKMLVSVVESGHGKKAAVPGYFIAGKTGTAQVPKKNDRGYEEGNNIGTFVGYGPVENPRFVAIVRINHPRTVEYAESTAAPAFGKIAEFVLDYMNIPPNREVSEKVREASAEKAAKEKEEAVKDRVESATSTPSAVAPTKSVSTNPSQTTTSSQSSGLKNASSTP